MTKVFVNIGLSLDGPMAPEGMTIGKPEHMDWDAKWGAPIGWVLKQQAFRDTLGLGPGGQTAPGNDPVRSTTRRIGANIHVRQAG